MNVVVMYQLNVRQRCANNATCNTQTANKNRASHETTIRLATQLREATRSFIQRQFDLDLQVKAVPLSLLTCIINTFF